MRDVLRKRVVLFVTTTVLLAISTVFPIKPRIENEKIATLSIDQDGRDMYFEEYDLHFKGYNNGGQFFSCPHI